MIFKLFFKLPLYYTKHNKIIIKIGPAGFEILRDQQTSFDFYLLR